MRFGWWLVVGKRLKDRLAAVWTLSTWFGLCTEVSPVHVENLNVTLGLCFQLSSKSCNIRIKENRKVIQIEPKAWKIKHETLHEARLRPSTVLSWPVPNRPEMADDVVAESIRILQMYLDGMLESMCDEARMEWLLGNTFCSVIELLLRICISLIWYQAWHVKQAGAFVREADRTFWAPARVWDAAQWKCPCIRANANSWGLCSYPSSLNVCFALRCDDFASAWQKISNINCQRCRPLRLIYNLFLQKIQNTVTTKRLGDLRSTNVQKIAKLKDSKVQAARDWMLFFCCCVRAFSCQLPIPIPLGGTLYLVGPTRARQDPKPLMQLSPWNLAARMWSALHCPACHTHCAGPLRSPWFRCDSGGEDDISIALTGLYIGKINLE